MQRVARIVRRSARSQLKKQTCKNCLFCVRQICNNSEALRFRALVSNRNSCRDFAAYDQHKGIA